MEKRVCKRKIRTLSIFFSDGVTEYSGITSDFSCSGLFIRTRKGLKEGTLLTMKLKMEDGQNISLIGIVKRTVRTHLTHVNNGMGVQLTSSPGEYYNFIKELYES
jgi:Tfp pilus assembly protein PilZ